MKRFHRKPQISLHQMALKSLRTVERQLELGGVGIWHPDAYAALPLQCSEEISHNRYVQFFGPKPAPAGFVDLPARLQPRTWQRLLRHSRNATRKKPAAFKNLTWDFETDNLLSVRAPAITRPPQTLQTSASFQRGNNAACLRASEAGAHSASGCNFRGPKLRRSTAMESRHPSMAKIISCRTAVWHSGRTKPGFLLTSHHSSAQVMKRPRNVSHNRLAGLTPGYRQGAKKARHCSPPAAPESLLHWFKVARAAKKKVPAATRPQLQLQPIFLSLSMWCIYLYIYIYIYFLHPPPARTPILLPFGHGRSRIS